MSEVYEVFIAVVTVVLLASLFTGAVEGQGRAQQPSAQASSESPGTTDRQIKARLAAKAQRTPAQRKVSSQLLDARRAAVAARRQARGAAPVDELVMGGHPGRRHAGGAGTHPGSGRHGDQQRGAIPGDSGAAPAGSRGKARHARRDPIDPRCRRGGYARPADGDAIRCPDGRAGCARTRTVNTSEGNVPH